jgi:hypothetical protein
MATIFQDSSGALRIVFTLYKSEASGLYNAALIIRFCGSTEEKWSGRKTMVAQLFSSPHYPIYAGCYMRLWLRTNESPAALNSSGTQLFLPVSTFEDELAGKEICGRKCTKVGLGGYRKKCSL